MGLFSDLKGTTENIFRVGTHAWKGITGGLAARNSADSADEKIQASQFEATGNTGLIINSDAAGSGADWTITINRPASGMSAAYTLTLPIDDGSPSQYLQTDGSGNLVWATVGGSADKMTVDTTSLAFGTSSPLTLFTTPANAIIHKIQIVIDTPFSGGTPTVTIGIAGTTSKYMSSGQNILTGTAKDIYESNPGETASAGESLIATYSAGGASAGAARILVYYSVPS